MDFHCFRSAAAAFPLQMTAFPGCPCPHTKTLVFRRGHAHILQHRKALSTITGQTHAKCTRRAQAPNGIQTESAPEWNPRWERPGSIPFRVQNSIHSGSCLVSKKETISDSVSDPKLNPFRSPFRVQNRVRVGFHFQSINDSQNEFGLDTKIDPGISSFWYAKGLPFGIHSRPVLAPSWDPFRGRSGSHLESIPDPKTNPF